MTGSRRRHVILGVQIAVSAAALTWLLAWVDLGPLRAALGRVGATALGLAFAVQLAGVVVATVRWRALLAAYGAPHRVSPARLLRLYLVGLFYNTYLPGAIGGDVVRGVATSEAFGERGATPAVAVVVVERGFGLAGLLVLVMLALAAHPLPGVEAAGPWAFAGVVAALGAILAVGYAHLLANWLPGPLGHLAGRLPTVERYAPLAAALGLSVVTHAGGSLAGWLLVSDLSPFVTFGDALVVVPLAMAAAWFPITVAGVGAREAAFVGMLAQLGVPRADALAASLLVLAVNMAVAGLGGLTTLVAPIAEPRE